MKRDAHRHGPAPPTPSSLKGVTQLRGTAVAKRLEEIRSDLDRANSTNRLPRLLELTAGEPPCVFWPIFLEEGNGCDRTWRWINQLLTVLREHHSVEPAIAYFFPEARAFYDSLPAIVEIFRGCSIDRVRGLYWTTSKTTAEGFASGHRGIPVPDPVIAEARIPKAAIFAVFTDRREDEVVIDRDMLSIVRQQAYLAA